MKNIVVVGGGIIGLSSALNIIENERNVSVTLIAQKLSPETTGDVAAGFISPYCFTGDIVPYEEINYWWRESMNYYEDLYQSGISSEIGVSLISGFWLLNEVDVDTVHKEHYLHYHDLSNEELSKFPKGYDKGFFFTTFTVECRKLLPYYRTRFEEKGGKIMIQKVDKLEQLAAEFDVIVNCAGLGARDLVDDTDLFPVRGQVIRVKAPWIKHIILAGSYYIVPNMDCIIIGGMRQFNDWNLNVSEEDSKNIRSGCEAIVPSLINSTLVSENVGLRPTRKSGPRVERETKMFNNKAYHIIHNYGHGGYGVTTSWGCAKDVLKLLKECIE